MEALEDPVTPEPQYSLAANGVVRWSLSCSPLWSLGLGFVRWNVRRHCALDSEMRSQPAEVIDRPGSAFDSRTMYLGMHSKLQRQVLQRKSWADLACRTSARPISADWGPTSAALGQNESNRLGCGPLCLREA